MAASQQQKVDFLLKKIGYTASKTGLAEDSSLTGTKKAPFAEAVPSPLVIANTSVWAESNQIPATPPGATGDYVRVYLSGTSGHRMTVDSTVSGNRSYIAYSTYNDNTSGILGDWIDTQFGSSYIVKVYKGDPNSGGVSLSAAGSGSSDGWFFDYSSGILNFNDTNVPTGVTDTNIYIVAYRYIGKKGVITAGAATSVSSLEVSGVSTFTGNIDANGSIDVDGHTELDNVNVSGVLTAAQFSGGSGGGTVIGEDIVTRNLTVSVGSTFSGAADFNGGADITGGLVANSAKVSDLTSGRVVVAGTSGELEDASTFTFSGGTVSATNFSGNLTGTLQTAAQTNITSVGTLTAVTVSGDITANGNIAGDSATNITGIAGVTATTLTGALQTAAQTNITSVGTLTGLDVNGHTELDNVNVSGVSTFTGAIDANGGLDVAGGEATLSSAVVSDLTSGRVVTAGTSGALQDSANLTFVADKLGVTGGLQVSAGATFGDVNVDGKTDLDDLSVTGVATFSALVDGNAGANFSGAETTLSSATVSDLTDNRVVLAGTSGALEDSSKITFDGTTFAIVGDATFTGNVSVAGTLTSEDKTDLDVIGIVTARTGVRINSGGLVVSSGVNTFTDAIDANGGLDVSGGSGLVASSAKVSDLTSGRVVVAGTSGELEDASTFTFSGGTVSATAFSATNLTGTLQTAAQGNITSVGTLTALNVNGHSELDFVNVSAAATFAALVDGNAGANFSGAETVLSSATVSDLTEGRVVVAGVSGALEDASTFTFSGGTVSATAFSATNLTGTLQTAAQTNITSLGTLSALGVAGDITMSSTDAGATANPILVLDRNSASPANNDVLGDILFKGRNAADEVVTYGSFMTKIATNTDGAEDGRLIFKTMKGGALSTVLDIKSDQMKINNVSEVFFADPITALKFEGATGNANELTLAITDPTGDVTVTIPSCDGTILTTGNSDAPTTTTSSSDADFILVDDGGTAKKITLSNLSSAITSVGTLGSLTVSGDITANGNIAGDDSTNITGIAGVTATTLTGTLQTAAQTNITSVGTLSNLTVSGNITANGNIVGDDATNITGIDAVIASTLAGTLQTAAQTNITSVGTLTGLNVNGHTDLDNTYISGITTFFHDVVIADTIRHDGDDNSKIRFLSGDTVSIETDNAERLRIVKGGGVGIGTTNPTAAVTSANTAVLAAGIVTAYQLYGDGSNLSGVGFEPTTGDSGTGNLYAGTEAGNASDTDTYCNVALGYRAGKTLNSGDFNVFLGTNAGCHADAGLNNISIGCNAAKTLTSGSDNIALGQAAMGTGVVTGDSNVAIGNEAGRNTTSGNGLVAIGCLAACSNTSGNYNLALGYLAAKMNSTGSCNISFGWSAAQNFTGSWGTFIGTAAGKYATTACHSIAIGCGALAGTNSTANSGKYNIAFGLDAGTKMSTGNNNVLIGCKSGTALTSGVSNVILGSNAGGSATEASNNVLIGFYVGQHLLDTSSNVFIGNATGKCTRGDNNIAMGNEALTGGSATPANNTGTCNIALGMNAGKGITSGNNNTLIGSGAGQDITTGYGNIALGNGSLANGIITGEQNIAFGCRAGYNLTSSTHSFIVGYQAMGGSTATGNHNHALGYQALTDLTSGSCNIAIGRQAGQNIADGAQNIFLGSNAGDQDVSSTLQIFIGCGAGLSMRGGTNIGLGMQALSGSATPADNTGENNIAIGQYAGKGITSGDKNIFIGCNAGNTHTSGNNSIAIGSDVELPSATGDNQFAIGCGTSRWILGDSSYNVCLAGSTIKAIASGGIFCATCFKGDGGALTGIDGFGPDSQENLYAGSNAGAASDADTCFNIALGMCAGCSLNEGDDNVILGGRFTGRYLTSGSRNVFIGCQAGMYSISNTDNVFLGSRAGFQMCNGDGNVAIGENALKGSTTTSDNSGANNIALGINAGQAVTSGSGNILLGESAGTALNTALCNIVMGKDAMCTATTSCCNIAIGVRAGSCLTTTSNDNIFMGFYAGRRWTAGALNNISIGKASGAFTNDGTGRCNIFIGSYTGNKTTSGCNNIGIGDYTGQGNTEGNWNISLGLYAGSACADTKGRNISMGRCTNLRTYGELNIAIGENAGQGTVPSSTGDNTGENNIFLGTGAGSCITTGGCNVVGGNGALCKLTTGNCNIAFGPFAGRYLTTGINNVFIGSNVAATGTITGFNNLAMGGAFAGANLQSANGNVLMSSFAGCSLTSGSCNVIIGYESGKQVATSGYNVFLGSYAGRCGTGDDNTVVGFKAMETAGNGEKNVAVGRYAGGANTDGDQNVFLGMQAGNTNTTGCQNIAIGYDVELPSATTDKQMAVGIATNRWITGHTDFSIGGVFKNYSETYSAIGNAGSTPTIDLEDGNVFSATLNSNATFTFTMGLNLPQTATSFTLILTNDGTPSRTISWPASVKWPNNSVPSRTTAASKTDIWSFMTPDGGTTWYGNVALYNFT